MAFLEDITTAIKLQNSSFAGDYSGSNINSMKKYGWNQASIKVKDTAPIGTVVEGNIVSNAMASGSLSDWGLDLFKPNFRTTLLRGGSLLPYKCHTSFKKKYVVFCNTKVYKFSTASQTHFDLAKSASSYYAAVHFFVNDSNYANSTYASSATTAGNGIVTASY
tara:strand:+ start:12748 stop:13239 length:492 start_codon:yes stop_codon:yes gene_type:complete